MPQNEMISELYTASRKSLFVITNLSTILWRTLAADFSSKMARNWWGGNNISLWFLTDEIASYHYWRIRIVLLSSREITSAIMHANGVKPFRSRVSTRSYLSLHQQLFWLFGVSIRTEIFGIRDFSQRVEEGAIMTITKKGNHFEWDNCGGICVLAAVGFRSGSSCIRHIYTQWIILEVKRGIPEKLVVIIN